VFEICVGRKTDYKILDVISLSFVSALALFSLLCREETLGFQFWRSGYWADHLRGLPYHISALYVVDLTKFRQKAVGDQLRAVYDK